MNRWSCTFLTLAFGLCIWTGNAAAAVVYWNAFNFEGEATAPANFVTYASLSDMLNDENRTGVFVPDGVSSLAAANIIGSGSDGTSYWNVFNFEGEATAPANFTTYASLSDMLNDENRTGVFVPDGVSSLAAANIIGSGSDGTSYWNVFNFEGEATAPSNFATYTSLSDMLNDENRTGVFVPDGVSSLAAANIIGSGSDGTSYWNVFNFEGEATAPANLVTYASLSDMLNDENRTGVFVPDGVSSLAAANIIGSGAFFVPDVAPVPSPPPLWLLLMGLSAMAFLRRGRSA